MSSVCLAAAWSFRAAIAETHFYPVIGSLGYCAAKFMNGVIALRRRQRPSLRNHGCRCRFRRSSYQCEFVWQTQQSSHSWGMLCPGVTAITLLLIEYWSSVDVITVAAPRVTSSRMIAFWNSLLVSVFVNSSSLSVDKDWVSITAVVLHWVQRGKDGCLVSRHDAPSRAIAMLVPWAPTLIKENNPCKSQSNFPTTLPINCNYNPLTA